MALSDEFNALADACESAHAFHAEAKSHNQSGIRPFDTRVLVLLDDVETKTAGGIIIPDQRLEKEGWAQTRGTLIAAGDNAFIEWGSEAAKPTPGARVLVAQYAGSSSKHTGIDGKEYRICKDEDILALLEAE